jgi:tetratricopeptide (TPR) repeat protein
VGPSTGNLFNGETLVAVPKLQLAASEQTYAEAQALHLEGLAHQEAGRFDQARETYEAVLALAPEAAVTRSNLGNVLRAQGKLIEAVSVHHAALNYDPTYAQGWLNLALTLEDAGEIDASLNAARHASSIAPNDTNIRHALGNIELAAGHPEVAVESFLMTLQANPRHSRVLLNLAVALKEAGTIDAGTKALETLIAIEPDNADAHFNLGLNLLSENKWADGFAAYEWRLEIPGLRPKCPVSPRWYGAPQPDATLLLIAEQGLGDTFQFLRFVRVARQRVARIVLAVQPALVTFLKGTPGLDEVISLIDPAPAHDVHLPLMSLPYTLGVDSDLGLSSKRWIKTDFAREHRWQSWLDEVVPAANLRIAIAWRGNPSYRKDASRSLALEHFAALAEIPGISLISLQKGPGEDELGKLAAQLSIIVPPALDTDIAFADTAALLRSVDLFVTSDSAIAHLAGALESPTWLLLSHRPDWRWGTDGTTTPWYPSMTLMRQLEPNDWKSVFDHVATAAAAQAGVEL